MLSVKYSFYQVIINNEVFSDLVRFIAALALPLCRLFLVVLNYLLSYSVLLVRFSPVLLVTFVRSARLRTCVCCTALNIVPSH